MYKKVTSVSIVFLMALTLILSLPQPVRAAGMDSGLSSISKLTKGQIRELLRGSYESDVLYEIEPRITPPYSLGKPAQGPMDNGLRLLNAMRRLAGLEQVSLSEELNTLTQHGAVVLAANDELSHYPSRPQNMDDAFYQQGRQATSRSNIAYMGGYGDRNVIPRAVEMFMDDSDVYNVSALGHRRWQLNPEMSQTGFGCATRKDAPWGHTHYVVEYSFDMQRTAGDHQFISWPSSGNFPSQLMPAHTAWSVSLNPQYYAIPEKKDLTIRITAPDGTFWTFAGTEPYVPADTGTYMNVDTMGYGYGYNCIIFRPDLSARQLSGYQGIYTVVIDGITDTAGNPVPFSYQVDFFDVTADTTEGWRLEDGLWYYYDGGSKLTGWLQTEKGFYYLGSDGAMQTGWQAVGGSWYYLGSDGIMHTGWLHLNGSWYYLNPQGHLAVNCWAMDSYGWCYLDGSGHLATSCWALDSTGWCYLDESGHLAANRWAVDSYGWCYLDESGHLATSRWALDSTGWCYLDAGGHLVTNCWAVDSYGWCYLDESGHLATSCWVQDSAGWCYVDAGGHLVTNCWVVDSYGWCYLDETGHLLKNDYAYDSHGIHYLDESGHMVW